MKSKNTPTTFLMVILAITCLLLALVLPAQAQPPKPDTSRKPFTITMTQQDAHVQFDGTNFVLNRIYKLHMDAILRDSLTSSLNGILNFLQLKYREAYKADSIKYAPNKPGH